MNPRAKKTVYAQGGRNAVTGRGKDGESEKRCTSSFEHTSRNLAIESEDSVTRSMGTLKGAACGHLVAT